MGDTKPYLSVQCLQSLNSNCPAISWPSAKASQNIGNAYEVVLKQSCVDGHWSGLATSDICQPLSCNSLCGVP